ncbi:hypothetical protein [Listeria costaricensis]|uniref:hypothetical protein n=1 Tax=Listeria costaricensis TaxID=2026604 RepID=UPI000C08B2A9|nr:hypothetical protein [Listeria costaricensis]
MEILQTVEVKYQQVSTNRQVDLLAVLQKTAETGICKYAADDYFQIHEDEFAVYFLHVIGRNQQLLAEAAVILKTGSLLSLEEMRRVYHLNKFHVLTDELAKNASLFPAWRKEKLQEIFGPSFDGFYQQTIIGEELPKLRFELEEELPFTPEKWPNRFTNWYTNWRIGEKFHHQEAGFTLYEQPLQGEHSTDWRYDKVYRF